MIFTSQHCHHGQLIEISHFHFKISHKTNFYIITWDLNKGILLLTIINAFTYLNNIFSKNVFMNMRLLNLAVGKTCTQHFYCLNCEILGIHFLPFSYNIYKFVVFTLSLVRFSLTNPLLFVFILFNHFETLHLWYKNDIK